MVAAWVSLISNILLTVIKITVGVLFNSQVLVADGAHNGADVIASAATVGSMRISSRPADEDHPYGHGKAEVLASSLVALILVAAAVFIAYESIHALFEPPTEAHWIALIAALISLVWKQVLYVYTIKLARTLNSKGLLATGYDHLVDVYASGAAVIGVGLGLIGQYYHFEYLSYGDPVSGIIVSVLVFKIAITMGKEALDVLMEKNIDSEKLHHYIELVQSVPNVKRIDRLRAREHGHYILVDVRVGVPGYMTIQQGHDISREIKRSIMEHHSDVFEVLIHLNPWYEDEDNTSATDKKQVSPTI
ncbi:cation diffusion facilitator family transporter [Tumebacillus permanentifrigoris]|uniref:Cation diffusion facilitator family transporter n=2 Tax=Tumebacillus permanentifrigoris TaxID=378543 RepID=A0A316D7Y6_9BACL|nr:cation diffusion facilitator family transporter [Tumebacillus permanentifrigoris]